MLALALAAPYLLPWYAMWFLPFVAAMEDDRVAGAAVAVACVLALTGVPAEPAGSPELWRNMMLGVHYGAAPLLLAAFALVTAVAITGRPGRLPHRVRRRRGRRPVARPGPVRPAPSG